VQGGLVCKAHRLLYHSTLGLGVIQKKKYLVAEGAEDRADDGETRDEAPDHHGKVDGPAVRQG